MTYYPSYQYQESESSATSVWPLRIYRNKNFVLNIQPKSLSKLQLQSPIAHTQLTP
jgi:hypothetical protein